MAKVVVTGGAGFIGSHLADALVARGDTVTIIDNLVTGKKENIAHLLDRIVFIEGSILNDKDLERAFADAEIVYHQAAIPSVPKSVKDPFASHEANATGTLKVLLAARDSGVKRVVYAASSSYYGDTPTLPKHEEMPANPLSPYAAQKYMGEAYAKQFFELYGLETVALRYFNIFGPRQDPKSEYAAVVPKFITLMKARVRPTIFGDGTTTRAFTYVSDAVEANILAGEAKGIAGQAFNIAGGGQTSLNELVTAINSVLDTMLEPEYTAPRPGDIKHSYADISKAERAFGFSPKVTLEEGLRRTAETLK